jgi:hypothetical protein
MDYIKLVYSSMFKNTLDRIYISVIHQWNYSNICIFFLNLNILISLCMYKLDNRFDWSILYREASNQTCCCLIAQAVKYLYQPEEKMYIIMSATPNESPFIDRKIPLSAWSENVYNNVSYTQRITMMITVAWHTAVFKPSTVPIFHSTTGNLNPFTWGEIGMYF